MKGWLYSAEVPAGKVFEGSDYVAKAAAGWVDSPALIGHEPEPKPEPEKPRGKPGPKPKGNIQ